MMVKFHQSRNQVKILKVKKKYIKGKVIFFPEEKKGKVKEIEQNKIRE